jgi:hypothetical protein
MDDSIGLGSGFDFSDSKIQELADKQKGKTLKEALSNFGFVKANLSTFMVVHNEASLMVTETYLESPAMRNFLDYTVVYVDIISVVDDLSETGYSNVVRFTIK